MDAIRFVELQAVLEIEINTLQRDIPQLLALLASSRVSFVKPWQQTFFVLMRWLQYTMIQIVSPKV